MEPSEGYAPDDLVSDHSEDQDDDTSYDEGADAEEEVGNYADFINMNDVQQLADAVLRDEESNRDEELSVDEEPSVDEAPSMGEAPLKRRRKHRLKIASLMKRTIFLARYLMTTNKRLKGSWS